MSQKHERVFGGYRKAICACGYVAEADSKEGANRKLIRHLLHPSAANKIADSPAEHAGCTIEEWSGRWSVCQDHRVYIDTQPVQIDGQEELDLPA